MERAQLAATHSSPQGGRKAGKTHTSQIFTLRTLRTTRPKYFLSILKSIDLGNYATAFLSKYELVFATLANLQFKYSSIKPLSFSSVDFYRNAYSANIRKIPFMSVTHIFPLV